MLDSEVNAGNCYRNTRSVVEKDRKQTVLILGAGFSKNVGLPLQKELSRQRPDKEWGLTDCISFVVMQDYELKEALTADEHFRQAEFRALLLEDSKTW